MIRILSAGAIIVVVVVAVFFVAWTNVKLSQRRFAKVERRLVTVPAHVLEYRRDVYLGYDSAIDTIERLLAADETRLLFTPSEQAELRSHVERFQEIQDPK